MDKKRRHELKMLKFKRRLKIYGYWPDYTKGKVWYNDLRTTSCPCSCFICQGEKYERHKFKEETRKIINSAHY